MKLTPSEALNQIRHAGADFVRLLERATFDVGLYRPEETDKQKPHVRDELYVIAAGSGEFICAGDTSTFAPGDVFFVPAGVEHRFMNFTPDFAAWVVFFGARPGAAN